MNDVVHSGARPVWWTTWRCLALGAACILLVLLFHQPAGWNSSSRLLTVYAVVQEGSLQADRWRGTTGDYAEIDGHLYSDKAPLASFVVVPFYWIWWHAAGRPEGPVTSRAAIVLADISACAIPFAVLAMLVLRRVANAGASRSKAVWLTLAATCGTPLFCYGGQYLGNILGALLLLGAYVCAIEKEDRYDLAGLLGGLAVLAEYPLALPNALLLGYLALGKGGLARATRYVFGAAAPALLLLTYNRHVTGHFFDLPYSHENAGFSQMRHGFGMAWPSPSAIWELLFGQYRGMLFYAPALFIVLPTLWVAFDGPARRRALVFVLMGTQVLFVASYFMWFGGWCVGPRHLAFTMALAIYEGAPAVARRARLVLPFAILSAWGIAIELAAVATDALPNETWRAPAFDIFFPRIAQGDINVHNLLVEAGLPNGRYVLALWVALFAAVGLALGGRPSALWSAHQKERP